MIGMDLTDSELAELPDILALARMNIGAQLANGAKDENGRAVALLAAISAIEAKLTLQVPDQTRPPKRKRNNGKEAHT